MLSRTIDTILSIRELRHIIPALLAIATQRPRYLPEISWSNNSIVHNLFRTYEYIFGKPYGITKESATEAIIEDGRVVQVNRYFYTAESVLAYIEGVIKKEFSFAPIRVAVPALGVIGNGFIPGPYMFAIALDDATEDTFTGDPDTFSHTTTGSDRVLWICAGWETTQTFASAPTYNSVSTTLAIAQVNAGGQTRCSLYYLYAPDSGSAFTVSGDMSSAPNGVWTAQSYTGAAQSGTPEDTDGSEGNSDTTSTTVSPSTASSWSVFAWGNVRPTTVASGGVARVAGTPQAGAGDSDGTITAPHTVTLTMTSAQIFSMAQSTIKPLSAAVQKGLLMMGIGQTS